MFSREFFYWCRDAVCKIKYWKDRNIVYEELYSHLEERYEALTERGFSHEEAEKMALEAMGDAKELAPQLAAIHKPYWAYGTLITRFVAAVLLIHCIAWGINYALDLDISCGNPWITAGYQAWDPYTQGGEERISYVKPNVSDSSDGYTFRVKEAALWRTYFDEVTEDGREYFDALYMKLKVTNPSPWMQEGMGVHWIWAVDSTGTFYESFELVNGRDIPCISFQPYRSGLFTYTYDLEFQELREDIEWIELHYDRDCRDVVLRVDLSREEEG